MIYLIFFTEGLSREGFFLSVSWHVDEPVFYYYTIRTVLSIALGQGWQIKQLYVNNLRHEFSWMKCARQTGIKTLYGFLPHQNPDLGLDRVKVRVIGSKWASPLRGGCVAFAWSEDWGPADGRIRVYKTRLVSNFLWGCFSRCGIITLIGLLPIWWFTGILKTLQFGLTLISFFFTGHPQVCHLTILMLLVCFRFLISF